MATYSTHTTTPNSVASPLATKAYAQPLASQSHHQRPFEENGMDEERLLEGGQHKLSASMAAPDSLAAQFGQAMNFGHQVSSVSAAPVAVQAKENDGTELEPASFRDGAGGIGSALPQPVQEKMEAAFGTSFSDVRVHETAQAKAIGAAAYTQGSNIYFAPGHYDPDSLGGQSLLGHELTHVVQQRAGRVSVPGGGGVPINADPSLEAEADRLGAQAARGQVAQSGSSAEGSLFGEGLAVPGVGAAPVQCGLFSKIGKLGKGLGKGIGKGIKKVGKKAIDIAPSLYDFGLDVASSIPGIDHYANGIRAVAGTEDSFLSSMIGGDNFGEALGTTAGSFLGGMNMGGMGMPAMGGGGMDVMSMLGGGGGMDVMSMLGGGGGMPAMGGGGMDIMSMFGGGGGGMDVMSMLGSGGGIPAMGGGQMGNISAAVGSGTDLIQDFFD
ncbi:MAG: DUF4157 domain-containing protein [Cyanobacteria bacterium J06634_6]